MLDEVEDQSASLGALLDEIPSVRKIKEQLDQGSRLKDIGASPGAITVLRWVVGSCRAYLKETKPGEGVIGQTAATRPIVYTNYNVAGPARQFTFVVGSPEQEENFQSEIEEAQKNDKNCVEYPTILAFHGQPIPPQEHVVQADHVQDPVRRGGITY